MQTIKTTEQGNKLMSYNGTEFWVNSFGVIMSVPSNNWNVVDELLSAGLVTRINHGRQTYGHVSYTIK